MAAVCRAVFLLFVCCGLVQCSDGECNISCTTDYRSMLNCSMSASDRSASCDVEAECRNELDSVSGSCAIRPPYRWCTIHPDNFFIIIEMDTFCTLKVKELNQRVELEEHTLSPVVLYHIIKPWPPVNLTLTKNNQAFNLSWDTVYTDNDISGLQGDLIYRVRLRPKHSLDEKHSMEYTIHEDCRHQEIRCELLLPGRVYVAEVQASVNPVGVQNSGKEWSDWSPSIEWTCSPTDAVAMGTKRYFLVFLAVIPFVLLLFGKLRWGVKLRVFQYIPNPQNFFKPLYHTYQGDFKKWVGPVLTFSTIDVLERSVPLQVLSEKPLAALPCQKELLQERGGGRSGSGLGDWRILKPSSNRCFLGSSSLGTTHSGGHISMDTVTVSDWTGGSGDGPQLEDQASLKGTNQRADGFADEDQVLGLDGQRGARGRGFEEWQLRANDPENEEISLDSFSSNDQYDDGYPQVGLDLDTIDSGFLESDCSSPLSSECDGGEHIEAALLGGDAGAHSNYVKQWVAFMPTPGDRSNSGQQSL
ncbi:interleukin 21 receptor, tandem duplicate 1 [Brachyhypopomus gauderio]|uniref:interleukin 21 receptor, tandem duplicate 1 n=1 Tax=Brachyhypopomus gauderio TaxID=698409 RepID=UPI0040436334